uniref:RNA 3'-terminal phosphate cyclase domain-containing protein n=3 Tax=Aegilops tauschii subsp. strangulata TaxID=200361 RepID=A0A453MCX8_AEGTS
PRPRRAHDQSHPRLGERAANRLRRRRQARMGRDKSRRLSGSRDFRQRLVLATLTSTPITIRDIRAGEGGLCPHEMSLLRLLDKVSDQHVIDVNDTGKAAPARGFFDLGWWLIVVGSFVGRDEGRVQARGDRRREGPGARLRGAPRDRLLHRAAPSARPLRQVALVRSAQRNHK